MATIFTTLNKSWRTSRETYFRSENNFDEIYTFQGLDWVFSPLSRSSLLLSTAIPLPTPPCKSFAPCGVDWVGESGAKAAELWIHYDKLMY